MALMCPWCPTTVDICGGPHYGIMTDVGLEVVKPGRNPAGKAKGGGKGDPRARSGQAVDLAVWEAETTGATSEGNLPLPVMQVPPSQPGGLAGLPAPPIGQGSQTSAGKGKGASSSQGGQ